VRKIVIPRCLFPNVTARTASTDGEAAGTRSQVVVGTSGGGGSSQIDRLIAQQMRILQVSSARANQTQRQASRAHGNVIP